MTSAWAAASISDAVAESIGLLQATMPPNALRESQA